MLKEIRVKLRADERERERNAISAEILNWCEAQT